MSRCARGPPKLSVFPTLSVLPISWTQIYGPRAISFYVIMFENIAAFASLQRFLFEMKSLLNPKRWRPRVLLFPLAGWCRTWPIFILYVTEYVLWSSRIPLFSGSCRIRIRAETAGPAGNKGTVVIAWKVPVIFPELPEFEVNKFGHWSPFQRVIC